MSDFLRQHVFAPLKSAVSVQRAALSGQARADAGCHHEMLDTSVWITYIIISPATRYVNGVIPAKAGIQNQLKLDAGSGPA
jgi:hypothetical protein